MDRSKVYFTRQQSRRVDELAIEQGIPGLTLMENAASGCVQKLMSEGIQSAIICAGSGNNGGDGFAIARLLSGQGVNTKTIVCGSTDRLAGDALTNYRKACELNLPILQIDDAWTNNELTNEMSQVHSKTNAWIVDAMLGTGATGNPRPPINRLIHIANQSDFRKIAIDVPSGLDCDSGIPGKPTFRADITCTFVTQKIGFKQESAKPYLGEVTVIPIGIPDEIINSILISDD